MHSYGSWPDEKFGDVERASYFIGEWLRRWSRMSVSQCKEKFGTARVYCSFGWESFYQIAYPGYMWVQSWWPYKLDLWISYHTPLWVWVNQIVVPIHKKLYVWRYKKAIQKYPYLYNEILSMADWGELFDGKIPGYKHSDYWEQVNPITIKTKEPK